MNSKVISRREFVARAALASAAVSTLATQSLNAAIEAAPKVAWCAFEKPLQFLTFDEVADVMKTAGFDGIEAAVRPGGHVLPEKVEEDLPRFMDALRKRGLEMTILTSGINDVSQPHAEKTLRLAARLGVKRYRLLWFKYDLSKAILPQLDAMAPKLKRLAALNRELGLTALYQNHSGPDMVGAPLWDIYQLIREFDPKEVALAYDIRHAAVEGSLSWPIQLNLVQLHIGAVCVKDFVWDKGKVKNVSLGEGMVDRKMMAALRANRISGPISVHVEYLEHSKDREAIAAAFKKDLATAKQWWGGA